MDIIDRANEVCEMDLAGRIKSARMNVQKRKESAKECKFCGEEIPLKRRMAMPGCSLCVACKSKLESGAV